ncbi:unnamed protein product [Lupinus luteus]|uniref:NAD-dependent epimerase/dehydratase domain-containing protein n=1 Tax=Lupinus luteus TaxID=3873 RepID=A0AAV1XHF7_LUPLU
MDFTIIVRPFNWIGPQMDFIPGVECPSEGVPRVLACFSNSLLRGEPRNLKFVEDGQSQRTFVYIKDATEVVLLMIVGSYVQSFRKSICFQIVQPQNKKKKQSIETRATDSNAVTTLHTNSSTMETLMSPDHLNNLRGDHLGVMYDATIPGHRVIDEPPDNSNINHRNVDAIRLYSVSIKD